MAAIFKDLEKLVKPGVTTAELEDFVLDRIKSAGGKSSFRVTNLTVVANLFLALSALPSMMKSSTLQLFQLRPSKKVTSSN
jgi:hypothetical protein